MKRKMECVITQSGIEEVLKSEQVSAAILTPVAADVAAFDAQAWLAFKQNAHEKAGWTVSPGTNGFSASKVYEGLRLKQREFVIRDKAVI